MHKTAAAEEGIFVPLKTLVGLQAHSQRILPLVTKPLATANVGTRRSAFRGRGMDFAEVRQYEAGDDIRYMDWRVTARTGLPHTKLFEEERERPTWFLMDFSSSLFFGTRRCFKSVLAAKSAALLAWASLQAGHPVGAAIAHGSTSWSLSLKGRRQGVLMFLNALVAAQQPPAANVSQGFEKAINSLSHKAKSGSLVFIISDFSEITEKSFGYLSRLAQRNAVYAIQVRDPLEVEPPKAGRYAVGDGDNQFVMDTGDVRFCRAYRHYFTAHQQKLTDFFKQHAIAYASLLTAEDNIAKALQQQGGVWK